MAPLSELSVLRNHLKRQGYTFTSNRHTELSRIKGMEGQRCVSYTVTLRSPCGKVTRHNAPERLELAYRDACRVTPEGLPVLPAAPLLGTHRERGGDAPLGHKARRERPEPPEMPTLF